MNAITTPNRILRRLAAAATCVSSIAAGSALGQVATVPTTNTTDLAAALNPSGLTITSVTIRKAAAGQIGTYNHFAIAPVTIHSGVVMSSGSVAAIGPLVEVLDSLYEPSSPPPAVNSAMVMDPDSGGTPEFDDYGDQGNHIENFTASFDVAALEVHFFLEEDSQVQFDFIFGSVEYPFWTSQFTDAFVVFLDGVTPNDQIAFDNGGSAVQVGSSFAGLTTTDDKNTAFAAPHGLIHHLTTTTERLDSGAHTLIFEVGDVNDHILDSAVFIANLRAGTGTTGTHPSDDCRADHDGHNGVTIDDLFLFLYDWFENETDADFNGLNGVTIDDLFLYFNAYFVGCP